MMTAAEIYESMDKCMEENKGKDFRAILSVVQAHAAKIGWSVGRTFGGPLIGMIGGFLLEYNWKQR